MALQFSTAVRNAMLDAAETTVGASAVLKLFTGLPPANCAAANSGSELCSMSLPSDWMADASSGVKVKSGTWTDSSADLGGDAGHFRIYAADGTTCHMQGTITVLAGGGDAEMTSVTVILNQIVTASSFTLTAGNG